MITRLRSKIISSFLLVFLYKAGSLNEDKIRTYFYDIIKRNSWERSFIESVNRVFVFGSIGIWV